MKWDFVLRARYDCIYKLSVIGAKGCSVIFSSELGFAWISKRKVEILVL